MTGGSYAGGIQLAAAAIDPRIDAIAPEIAWNDLPASIFPDNVPKLGWDTALYGVGQSAIYGGLRDGETGSYNPVIHESYAVSVATNDPSPYHTFYDARSPKYYVDNIDAATLVIQGTIDTLFTLNQGIANYNQIRDNLRADASAVPTKLLMYNDGHTIGSSVPKGVGDDNARTKADNAILNWFAKHLKGSDVSTGANIVAQDQLAKWHAYNTLPAPTVFATSGSATVVSGPAPTGGGGPTAGNPNGRGSARIPYTLAANSNIVGIPRVSGHIDLTGVEAFLFFKLVNTTTNDVLDDQITPLRIDASGDFSFDLEGVSYELQPGHSLALEISGGATPFTGSRTPGLSVITNVIVELPIA